MHPIHADLSSNFHTGNGKCQLVDLNIYYNRVTLESDLDIDLLNIQRTVAYRYLTVISYLNILFYKLSIIHSGCFTPSKISVTLKFESLTLFGLVDNLLLPSEASCSLKGSVFQ